MAHTGLGLKGALGIVTIASATSIGAAQSPLTRDRQEVFEAIDPYTRGDPGALARAGYLSFGPFEWMAGTRTDDVERVLAEPCVLWLESAHFKLGSTLGSYSTVADQPEREKLREEFERLGRKFADFRPPKNVLDPWLRLHLYAQRLEEQYATFQECFGLADADFDKRDDPADAHEPTMGLGPYLGMPMKFTVLLTEKNSTLARFLRHYLSRDPAGLCRTRLDGGSMFLGRSEEDLWRAGSELDVILQCAVTADVSENLLDGFQDNGSSCAAWLRSGLSSWFSRRIDARWTVYARGTTNSLGDDSWQWEPRVRGLVKNGFAVPWVDMLAWKSWDEIDPQGHMVVWSRVDWLLGLEQADRRKFLLECADSLADIPPSDREGITSARQHYALHCGFGKTLGQLDEEWKKAVLKRKRD